MDPADGRRRRAELLALASRSREVVLLAAVTGALTGLGVALFERVVIDVLFDHVSQLSPWLLTFAPGFGLRARRARLALPRAEQRSGDRRRLPSSVPRRRHAHCGSASYPGACSPPFATLGFGGAWASKAPRSISALPSALSCNGDSPASCPNADRRLLLVAGAAAGVAAIFKAPATGAIFALEVPYQDDLARRMLLPSLVGAASGYLAFVAVNGTTPHPARPRNSSVLVRDLAGAVALGIAAGVGGPCRSHG